MRTVSLFREQLIPAWAGKTTLRVGQQDRPTAHPRVGEENASSLAMSLALIGSSPRGRGKPIVTLAAFTVARLIPARAGKTPAVASRASGAWAHPRAGGENSVCEELEPPSGGSSPRGRGKPPMLMLSDPTTRLIPARAGKTSWSRPPTLTARTHPRAGGENNRTSAALRAREGSSPRGRGKPPPARPRRGRQGLIPAWAGKTCPTNPALPSARAHPRVGGENTPPVGALVCVTGSSPRGRGKPRAACCLGQTGRLIPAWAGKTFLSVTVTLPLSAHPRVGGENTS